MIEVRACTRLQPLAEALVERIRSEPLPPLQDEMILVAQNRGMRAWLELEIARQLGCAASLPKLSPSSFEELLIEHIVHPSLPGGIQLGAYELDALTWRVLRRLDDLPSSADYDALRNYLDAAPGSQYVLARRIAGYFDNYGVFRPDVLAAWEEGENPCEEHSHSVWQAALWRVLTQEAAHHPAKLRSMLLDELGGLEAPPACVSPRISVFGAGVFPPVYLDVLHAIGECGVDVTFYTVGSTRENWRYAEGDLPAGELLRTLGAQGRELFVVVDDVTGGGLRCEEVSTSEAGANELLPDSSLLRRLQVDLVEQIERRDGHDGTERYSIAADDRSTQIHSCHSPVRELEVLRDQLFRTFDENPDLKPDDVLVVVSDLDTYAPLLDAVWGAEHVDGHTLPYHVIDSPWTAGRQVVQAVRQLLALAGTRWTTTAILELLSYPAIRRSADIRLDEMAIIREWVREGRVCWGRDGAHKSRYDLPDDDVHTWVSGLERLLLGYATGPVDGLVLGRAPLGESTTDRAELLGRLIRWLRHLFIHLEALDDARTLPAWSDTLGTVTDDLLSPRGDDEEAALQRVRQWIGGLRSHTRIAATTGADAEVPVDGAAIRRYMDEKLSSYREDERFVTGRVTVSDFMTMRFVPHRVVAMVGMNDDLFPRRPSEDALDLVEPEPRPGDTDVQAADKQLFLDALQTARDQLIITYVGRSQKDNSERPPSIAVELLLETVCGSCTLPELAEDSPRDLEQQVRRRVVVPHRLQPFSPAYFDGSDARLFSYAERHCASAGGRGAAETQPFIEAPLEAFEGEIETTLRELQQVWTNPSQFFCHRRLGFYLRRGEDTLPDVEPLQYDTLAKYQLDQLVLTHEMDGTSASEQYDRLDAEGHLPPGQLGRAWLAKTRSEVAPVVEPLRTLTWDAPRTVYLAGQGWTLTGRFEHLAGDKMVRFRAASIKPKDWVRAWVAHVVANAYADARDTTFPRTTVLVGVKKGSSEVFHLPPIDDAAATLERLMGGWRESWEEPPPLFEKASDVFAEKGRLDKAIEAFAGNDYSPGDLHDDYVALCWRGRNPFADDAEAFQRWAKQLWEPILKYQTGGVPA